MVATNQLALYERIPDPTAGANAMGTAIAKSGMFGCSSVDQGIVFGWECLARGIPPLMLAERYHIIFGKLSMKAEAMLAGFEQQGGKYKVVSRTPDLVAMEMTIGGEVYNVSLSWDEAQGEPFCYDGKESDIVKKLTTGNKKGLELKPKYATPRARMQMLWARLVSDSVRFLCPNVVSGVYTPEEIEDFDENQQSGNANGGKGKAKPTASVVEGEVVSRTVEAQPVVAVEMSANAPVTVTEVAPAPATPTAPTTTTEPTYCTAEQSRRIQELYIILGVTVEAQHAALAKRKVNAIRSLTTEQADEILGKLEANLAAKFKAGAAEAEAIGGESKADAAAITTTPASPCTPAQIDKAKAALAEYKQIDADFNNKLKARLIATGRQKISDLSERDCDRLIALITGKQGEQFFKLDLETYAAVKADERAAEVAKVEKKVTREPGDESENKVTHEAVHDKAVKAGDIPF